MKNKNKIVSFFTNTFCIIFGILVSPFVLLFYAILTSLLVVVGVFSSLVFMSINIGYSVLRKEMPERIELFFDRMHRKINTFFDSMNFGSSKDIDDEKDYFDDYCDYLKEEDYRKISGE